MKKIRGIPHFSVEILITASATSILAVAFLLVENEIMLGVIICLGLLCFYTAKQKRIPQKAVQLYRNAPFVFYAIILFNVAMAIVFCRNEHFALFMIASVAIFSTACLGITLQLGYAGLTNFAGAAFLGVGGYTVAVLGHHNIPDVLVILLGGVMASIIGSLLILPVLRTRGHYAALVTIAFALLFKTFLEINDALGGPQGLKIDSFDIFGWDFNEKVIESSFYISYVLASLFLLLIVFILIRRIEKSWVGLQLDAVRLDEIAASCFGINIALWKIIAFTLGNFFIGLAGGLYAQMLGHIAPTNFTFSDSLILISIVILGGIGNPLGVLPAAFLIIVLPEKLQFIQEYRFLLFSVLVILVLVYRPEGLLRRRLRSFYRTWGHSKF